MRAELKITGMTCEGCVRAVERHLKTLTGVQSAKVDLKKNAAQIEYDGSGATPPQMAASIERLGYEARVK